MGFLVGTRSFNKMEIDSERRIARKTSLNGPALAKEINWYLSLPDDLADVSPKILEYELDPTRAFLEMEALDAASLSELFIADLVDVNDWSLILDDIEILLDRMSAHACREVTDSQRRDALLNMYETKTAGRLRLVLAESRFDHFRGRGLRVNGVPAFGIAELLEVLPSVLERAGLLEVREFTIIHGDLCLSNVLRERSTGCLRLVDPRGDYGGLDVHGDPLYDLAKLCHSFEGGYDLLLAGRFDYSCVGREVALSAHWTSQQASARDLFLRWSRDRWSAEQIERANLIVALLFLSMVPLHADRPQSQAAFLSRGLERFTQAATQLGSEPTA